jgi:hypothetical protein
MSDLTVNPATLVALQATLANLFSGLSSMHSQVSGYQGVLGGSDLEGEVGHFLSRWHDGISLLEGDMKKVVQRLGAAASAYERSETLVASASQGCSPTGAGAG